MSPNFLGRETISSIRIQVTRKFRHDLRITGYCLRLIRKSNCQTKPRGEPLNDLSKMSHGWSYPSACLRFLAFLTRLVQKTRAWAATKSVRETSAPEPWNGDTTKTTIDADDNRWKDENRAARPCYRRDNPIIMPRPRGSHIHGVTFQISYNVSMVTKDETNCRSSRWSLFNSTLVAYMLAIRLYIIQLFTLYINFLLNTICLQ